MGKELFPDIPVLACSADLHWLFEMRGKQKLGAPDISSAELFRRINADFRTRYVPSSEDAVTEDELIAAM